MESLLTIGKAVLVLFAVASVALPLISERRNYEFVWQVWKRFRITMFVQVFGILLLTIAVTIALCEVPGMKYGWINLFFGGGGNMLIKPITDGSQSTSASIRLMVPLFFFALMLVLPFLARSEERSFRKGYDEWGPIIKQSVKFGLVHCLVGVPLAAGIALIIPGFFFGCKYKRAFDSNTDTLGHHRAKDEAVMVSTTYHTMYNMFVVALLLVIAVAKV